MALRVFVRAPAFSLTVVLTLGLAFGINTAVFSAIDAIVLQPLPFPGADRLVRVTQTQPDTAETNIAPVRVEDWQRLTSTFEAITGYSTSDVSDTTGELAERTRLASVAPRFLDVWRVSPALGRGFVEGEHRFGGPRAVLISDRYWRNRLGAAPDVLTRSVRVDDGVFAIVGVLPPSFLFPDPAVDLWVPANIDGPFSQRRELTWYTGIGRLRAGVTVEQARAELDLVQSQLGSEYPATDGAIEPRVEPLKGVVIGGAGASLWLLFGAVTVLLVVACTNTAALFLARAARRSVEVAIRQSLGASRSAIVRQMFAETAVLVLVSAVLGAFVAGAAAAALGASVPSWPRLDSVGLDWRTFAYVAGTAALVAAVCVLVPALRATRAGGSLAGSQRALVGTRNRFQWGLVGVQVALSVVLLAGAGLLLRSSAALSRVDAGFDAGRVLTFRLSGSFAETGNRPQFAQRIRGTLDALRELPEIEHASTTILLPGVRNDFSVDFEFTDGGIAAAATPLAAQLRVAAPSYFATLAIPLVAGALCREPADGSETDEFMVNRSFAERYLAGRSPLGIGLRSGGNFALTGRIAGVVGDAREMGMDRVPVPTVYPCLSAASPFAWFALRTRGDPLLAVSAVRGLLAELEPARAVYEIAPLEQQIGGAYRANRLRTWVLAVFAVAALALACIGLYGTLSYVVSLRHREVGLRMALGARRERIVATFMAKALRVVGAATLVGTMLSLPLGRGLRSFLYGVAPWDPLTLGAVALLMIGLAAFAAALPAARAARVDPMTVLRED